MTEEKQTRTVDVGFTKISDDVIVPSWRMQIKEGESFRDNKIVWWVLGGFWLVCVYIILNNRIELTAIGVVTVIVLFFGAMWHFLGKIPQKWIELSRKDGFVSVWTSRKKRRLIGRWHIDKVTTKMNKRCVSGSQYHSSYHYLIELFHNDPAMKNPSFWKFNNHPQKNDAPFFVLFDMFEVSRTNDKINYERRVISSEIAQNVDRFIRDFMAGKPLPQSSSSTYTFTAPE